jgi:hypothetical protein
MVSAEASVEEILLTASAVPDEPRVPDIQPVRLRFELVQKNPSRGIRLQFGVGSDERLHVTEQARRRNHRYQVGLVFLDPEPRRRPIIAKVWGYLAGAWLLAAGALGVVAHTALAAKLPVPPFALIILCIALGIVCLLVLIYRSRLLLRYHTRHGGVEVVELLWGLPSRQQYHDFVARLSGAIRKAQRRYEWGPEQALADELREHRRLYQAGIVNNPSYEAAKRRILAAHTQPRV